VQRSVNIRPGKNAFVQIELLAPTLRFTNGAFSPDAAYLSRLVRPMATPDRGSLFTVRRAGVPTGARAEVEKGPAAERISCAGRTDLCWGLEFPPCASHGPPAHPNIKNRGSANRSAVPLALLPTE